MVRERGKGDRVMEGVLCVRAIWAGKEGGDGEGRSNWSGSF